MGVPCVSLPGSADLGAGPSEPQWSPGPGWPLAADVLGFGWAWHTTLRCWSPYTVREGLSARVPWVSGALGEITSPDGR